MDDERKHYVILSAIICIISVLLLIRTLPNVLSWNTSNSNFIWDLLGLLWPVIGFSIIFDFVRKERDKWGWGGLLFHIFILYSALYYLILSIQSILTFSLEPGFIMNILLYITISSLGWIGYLLYYD